MQNEKPVRYGAICKRPSRTVGSHYQSAGAGREHERTVPPRIVYRTGPRPTSVRLGDLGPEPLARIAHRPQWIWHSGNITFRFSQYNNDTDTVQADALGGRPVILMPEAL
jgi:hypothetical protein